MKIIIFLFFFFLIDTTYAYQLVIVQSVSTTERTFITRGGKKNGIDVGQLGIFTTKNVSIAAHAIESTHNMTMWKVRNPNMKVPFAKMDLVNYSPADETLWFGAMGPGKKLKKGLLSSEDQEQISEAKRIEDPYSIDSILVSEEKKNNITFYIGASSTLSESITKVSRTDKTKRGSYQFMGLYHSAFFKSFYLGGGFRYDQEVADSPGGTFLTIRNFLLLSTEYHFDSYGPDKDQNLYLGLILGYGSSKTDVGGFTFDGDAYLLPETKLGYRKEFTETISALVELAFENIIMNEVTFGDDFQTTQMTNLKFQLGLRAIF